MEEQKLAVQDKGAGERLDKALCTLLDISRKRSKDLLDQENVLVNDVKEKASYKVNAGDVITILDMPTEEIDVRPENIPLDIVYEDEDILVINKPRGMVVHPAPG
ncbi:MAG TPA: RNA pseudouridine synthase, partial [Erysipelotrichaceae bacterium]|nr:RNA pseudouridine synthase [Erysipelotrichaceae bacterium]